MMRVHTLRWLAMAALLGACASEVPDAGAEESSESGALDDDIGVTQQAVITGGGTVAAEATVYEDAAGNNGGGFSRICIGNKTMTTSTMRAYVRYTLPTVPSGSTVTRVTLEFSQVLVRSSGGPLTATMELREVTGSWSEGSGGTENPVIGMSLQACGGGANVPGIDWMGAPGNEAGLSGTESLAATMNPATSTVTFDTNVDTSDDELIDDVQDWLDGTRTNNGWMVQVNEEGTANNARLLVPGALTVYYTAANGESCSTDSDCTGGNCVAPDGTNCDGSDTGCVCCNAATCTGECETCHRSGSVGTCGAEVSSQLCGPAPSCSAGTETLQATCTGSSTTCPTGTMNSCAPYICGTTACLASCGGDSDCSSGNFCNGSNNCEAERSNGTSCTAGNQCASDQCVDGVCCNTACTDQCAACNNGGSVGTCSARSGAPLSPRTACTDTDSDGCDGTCNGSLTSACTYPSGVCRTQSCAGSSLTEAASCNGNGSCPAMVTNPCPGNFACQTGTACRTSCGIDAHCASGNYCDAGSCVPLEANGTSCSMGNECASTLCVDGVCCDGTCTGQCEACDVAGSLGTCSAVTGAPTGGRMACNTDSTVCGGTCNGSNRSTCTFPGMGTECRAASCSINTATQAANCQGDGTCGSLVEIDCSPFTCSGDACGATSCTVDSECASGFYCSGTSCVPLLTNGLACALGTQCVSGECVDDVCCDRGCGGQCEACDQAGSIGTCSTVTSGAPQGGRPMCLGTGTSCLGSCDGSSATACGYPGAETNCAPASCTAGVASEPAACAGDGSCAAAVTLDCSPYGCNGDVCASTCANTLECAVGFFCSSGSICEPLQPNGDACTLDEQCQTGECVDGVCCDTACDGQCSSCGVSGMEGTCSPISGDPVGGRPPCASDGGVCAGTCNGVNGTTCTFPGAETSCRDQSCGTETLTEAAVCAGNGSCGDLTLTPCSPFRCEDATQCRTTCADGSECVGSAFCSAGGLCIGSLALGQVCTTDGQCISGQCADGVCCDSDCNGQCEVCNASGACTPVTGAPVGGRPACTDDSTGCGGSCDGSTTATCTYPDTSTACRSASCTDGVATEAATCDGVGSCSAVVTDACTPYFCDGTACGVSCADSTDCVTGSFCDGSNLCFGALPAGSACNDNGECASGTCADGVCCNTECTGQCESCIVPGRTGSCTPVLGLPRNGRPACDTDGTVCGGLCDGETRETCTYPGAETECREASCVSRRATQSASCGGDGNCPDEVQVDCEANCEGDVCGTPEIDAGPPEEDAGMPADAMVELDAGMDMVDAGTDPMDDGGCSCRAAAPERDGRGWVFLLVGAVWLIRRRRK
ncbi:MAG: DNRLRE domain-containing protein [Sandaracinaceae bacterium]